MRSGIINIVIGLVGVVLGLQLIPGLPRMTLIGTGSSQLLAVFGGVVAAFGVYQIGRDQRR